MKPFAILPLVLVCLLVAVRGFAAPIDQNSDGLADLWQLLFSAGTLAANEDNDNDGFDNARESLAGTDPRDASSYPEITDIARDTTEIEFHWPGVPGKRYQVQYSPNLAAWSSAPTSLIATTPSTQTFTLALASTPYASNSVLFFRLAVVDVDSDSDSVSDYEEWLAGYDPLRTQTFGQTADREGILQALATPSTLTAGATVLHVYENSSSPARFTLSRSGGLAPLSIHYTLSGSASAGNDFTALPGTVQLPIGKTSVDIELQPLSDSVNETTETAVLTLSSDSSYLIGTPSQAVVTIDDAPETLYVAQLHPVSDTSSGGFGLASVRLAGNQPSGRVALSFSNLRATEVGADFYVSDNGASGPAVLALPAGQITSTTWEVVPTAGLTRDQIIAALTSGRLWARVRSNLFSDGEIFGRLSTAVGWQTFTPPPAPSPAPTAPNSDVDAARFLIQTTFGPTTASIQQARNLSYATWIDQQMALPATSLLTYVQTRRAEWLARTGGTDDGWQTPLQEGFWQAALSAPDQLRQRMALALSEILVVSLDSSLEGEHEGVANYNDLLLRSAFGNYRTLLEDVTLSPMMGQFLSMIRNQKPNTITGAQPDENFAREVMQLFSIGLSQLHPDGTLKLDDNGLPIPTYTQNEIVGLAHVFTGWGPHYDTANPPRWDADTIADRESWFIWGWDPLQPMTLYPEFQDTETRAILDGVSVPASLTGTTRTKLALDTLFQHPNTGPFIARQLIQRFVTSNPSPAYVYRVAQVFANDGTGTRGNLGATLRTLLLDPEARGSELLADQAFGKPIEPLLRFTRLFRAFPIVPPHPGDARFFLNLQWNLPEQSPLLSPTVFNFFQPNYAPPGRIAAAGLAAPEFQIYTETTAISQANLQGGALSWGLWSTEPSNGEDHSVLTLNLAEPLALLNAAGRTPAQAQADLLDFLNLRLLGGHMSSALRTRILAVFTALPAWFDYSNDRQLDRVRTAVYLVLTSPEFAVQR